MQFYSINQFKKVLLGFVLTNKYYIQQTKQNLIKLQDRSFAGCSNLLCRITLLDTLPKINQQPRELTLKNCCSLPV